MKGLTLWQPWASLIATGAKTIETRSWHTNYRGSLLIHAAKRHIPSDDFYYLLTMIRAHAPHALSTNWPCGAVVATCELTQCISVDDRRLKIAINQRPQEAVFGNFAPGRWAWILSSVRKLPEPIPWKGAQGLWDVPRELVRRIDG